MTDKNGWGGLSLGIVDILKLAWSGNKRTYSRHRFDLQRVETHFFQPSQHYIQMSMTQPAVVKCLNKNESIFMIVDIRIAHGAFIVHEEFSGAGAAIAANIPFSAAGLGPDVGANAGGRKLKHTSTESRVSHSFIFAYRLLECRYDRVANTFQTRQFTKKANIQGLEGDESEEDEEDSEPGSEADNTESIPIASDFTIKGLAEDYTTLEGNSSKFKDGCILVGVDPRTGKLLS